MQRIWKNIHIDGLAGYSWVSFMATNSEAQMMLGEMHFVPTTPHSWFNLPRGGGIAYAAQESWVQSDSIRDNILFGSPYSEERYKKGEVVPYDIP